MNLNFSLRGNGEGFSDLLTIPTLDQIPNLNRRECADASAEPTIVILLKISGKPRIIKLFTFAIKRVIGTFKVEDEVGMPTATNVPADRRYINAWLNGRA